MAQEQQPLEILVIDDSDDLRRMYSRLLNLAGANVTTAEDGEQGLVLYEEAYGAGRPPDAVFMDFNLPGLDGIEVTRRIKEKQVGAIIYLITATELDVIDARLSEIPEELRPDKIIRKPFSYATLRDLVDEIRSIKYPTEGPPSYQPPSPTQL